MNRFFSIPAIIVFVVLGFQAAYGQFEYKTTLSTMYDDNVNNNALNLKSSVSLVNFKGGHTWEDENSGIQLYYDGSFNYYASLIARSNHYHSVNIEYTHLYGDEYQNILNAGGSLGGGFNRDEYTIFNHNSLSAYVNFKYFATERVINKFGYAMRMMNFSTLADLNYTEHAVFAHTALAITQSTTLILQTDLGTKFYSSVLTNDSSGSKKGKSSILPAVAQLTGMIKIGQQLSEVSGLSLTSRYQWNMIKQSRFLSSEYGLISDDELFDDHYGYEGLQANLLYTHIISESLIAKVSGGFQNKLYSTLPAYDLDGNIIGTGRADTRSYVNLQVQKNFEELGFSAKASLDIIYNRSNDPLYNYHNNAFMLEISVPF